MIKIKKDKKSSFPKEQVENTQINRNEKNNGQARLTHKNTILELFKSMKSMNRTDLQSRAKYIGNLLGFIENLDLRRK